MLIFFVAERDAIAAMESIERAKAAAREAEMNKTMEQTDVDITLAGLTTTAASVSSVKPSVKKKPGKPKLTAKEKKERSVCPFYPRMALSELIHFIA